MRIVSVLIFIVLANPAWSKYEATTKAGWYIWQGDDQCFLMNSYKGAHKETIIFTLDWQTDQITFSMFSDKWKSLETREDKFIDVDINLSGSHLEYDNWYDKEAEIKVIEGFGSGFLLDFEKSYKENFLTDWMLAESFQITADGRNLGGYKLTGTYEALPKLVQCASRARINDDSDPFAR